MIPATEHTAGLTFHYDAPGARPPQAIVLAVHPDPQPDRWDIDTVLDTIDEVAALARLRTLSLKETEGFAGLLPALYLPNNYTRDVPSVPIRWIVEVRSVGRPVDQSRARRSRGSEGDVSDIWQLPNDQLDLELIKLPSIVTWSRLEPMCLSADLLPGLQALSRRSAVDGRPAVAVR